MATPLRDIDEQELCDLLDQYVALLQKGDAASCREWLEEHPALSDVAQCLAALDQFAGGGPPAAGGLAPSPAPGVYLAQTIVKDETSLEASPENGASPPTADFG